MCTDNDEIKNALLKRALGYDSTEITEEYAEDSSGQVRMLKRKVVSKNVPPDVSAVKLLCELDSDNYKNLKDMTDDELEREKLRLLKLLNSYENDNK